MRSRVAERDERVKLFQTLFSLFAFHGLRFVDDKDRVRLGNDINGTAASELIQFHVDTTGVFAFGIKRL